MEILLCRLRGCVRLAGRTLGFVLCIMLFLSSVVSPQLQMPVISSSFEELNLSSDTGKNPAQVTWHVENFTKTAQFFATLQGPDGGMKEAEDNPFENTDNTLESIWVWCRYYQLTGDNTYYPNVLKAWNYSVANPAWEESDSGKVYSSAWALAAEQKFREVYGDWSYSWYANASMWFIDNVSAMEPSIFFNLTTKKHIRGWAAGNMYSYALGVGNETAKWNAVEYGNQTMRAIEAEPQLLSLEGWALAGGTSMWGIWQSSMQEFPNASWMRVYAPYLKKAVINPGTGAGRSQIGWEAWYAGGHYGIWEITGDRQYYLHFLNITDRQIAADGDGDGGLPTNYGEADDTDESWVTSYRAFMILDLFNRMPSGSAPTATNLQSAELSAEDVLLTWSLSGDDGSGEMDVFAYEIFYSANNASCGIGSTGFARLGVVYAGVSSFLHIGGGGNQTNYTYFIATRDYEGWRTVSASYGGKCSLPLSPGMNLISIPFLLISDEVSKIFQSVSPESVWFYDSRDQSNPWRLFDPDKPFSELVHVNATMGLWVGVPSYRTLPVAGMFPSNVSIPITRGWNLIGFPSSRSRTVAEILGGVPYDAVEGFHRYSPPYHLRAMSGSDTMEVGRAYWIHALANGSIQIEN